jgi:tellurite resistance protein TerC
MVLLLQTIPFFNETVLYLLFSGIILVSLTIDFLWMQSKNPHMTLRSALVQAAIWISLAIAFGILIWMDYGRDLALQYFSGYLMEYSLSVDNIFVFVLILTFFAISEKYYRKVLFYGITLAIFFRIIFITIGIALVQQFHWILYIFGAILIYTGIQILFQDEEKEFKPEKNLMYRIMNRYLKIVTDEGDGNLQITRDGKKFFTRLFLVVGIIGFTDLIFAIDSIPAVFAISQDQMVVLTSNIFAVLGLRSMFFILMSAVNRFIYLQEGISIVLIFIGLKMLVEIFSIHISTEISLLVIVAVLSVAILFSLLKKKNLPHSSSKD